MNNNIIKLGRCTLVILLSALTVLATAQIKTSKNTLAPETKATQNTTNQTTDLKSPTGIVLTYAFVIEDDIMQSNSGDDEKGNNRIKSNDAISLENASDVKDNRFTTSVLRELAQEIKIYPIPANTFTNIDLGKVNVKGIDVINSLGQKVYSQTLEQQFIRLDISNYQTGIYFIQMTTTENQVLSKSIVVN